MPTYGYRCGNGHEFETVQGIRDDPLTKCEVCEAPVRRIFYPVGIVFKGPGFYKTDSRASLSSSSLARGSSSDKDSSSDSSSSSDKGPGSSGDKASTKSETKKTAKKDPKPASSGGDSKAG